MRRARGSTTARRAGELKLRRTQPMRHRRRTDIEDVHLLSDIATRLGRKMREGGASPGPFEAFTRGGGSLAQLTPRTGTGLELHLTDEPLVLCLYLCT